jgi:ribokinase
MTQTPHICVVGYLSIDTISVAGHTLSNVPGGAALYAALGARALGARVSMIACAGDDYPEAWLAQMSALDIDISRLRRKGGPTRRAELVHKADGNRTSAHHDEASWWGRTLALAPEPVAGIDADMVLLAPMPPELAMRVFASTNCPVIADTSAAFARLDPKKLMSLIEKLACFAPSLEESRILFPYITDGSAVRQLAAKGPHVVQKRGAAGLATCAGGTGRVRLVRAAETPEVDPTGAGDATVGALAAGLASGLSLHDAARRAAGIGARAVSGHGPSALGFAWQRNLARLAS